MPSHQAEDTVAIARFWREFQQGLDAWNALPPHDRVPAWNDWLADFHPELAFELSGREDQPPLQLILTAHGRSEHFPLLSALVAQAPALPGYQLEAFRSRSQGTDFGISMDGMNLETRDLLVRHYADDGQVGLEIGFAEAIPEAKQDQAAGMAMIILDHVLGEYDFAVKVGCVDFVFPPEPLPAGAIPLNGFRPVFDAFWQQDLGHTGLFPSSEQSWRGLEVSFPRHDGADQEEISLVSVNESANALAMRADLAHALTLSLPVRCAATLKQAQELQDNLAGQLEQRQEGILAYTLLRGQQRHAVYYVSAPEEASARARQMLAREGLQEGALDWEADCLWSSYFQFARLGA